MLIKSSRVVSSMVNGVTSKSVRVMNGKFATAESQYVSLLSGSLAFIDAMVALFGSQSKARPCDQASRRIRRRG